MSIGTEIIQDAFSEIGAHSEASPASADSIIKGMRKLNAMLQSWTSQDIILETVPLSAPGLELGEPPDSRNAIVTNLAIQCAPLFDNGKVVVSNDLRTNARKEFSVVKRLHQDITINRKGASSTLVKGQGNRDGFRTPVFFGDDKTVGN